MEEGNVFWVWRKKDLMALEKEESLCLTALESNKVHFTDEKIDVARWNHLPKIIPVTSRKVMPDVVLHICNRVLKRLRQKDHLELEASLEYRHFKANLNHIKRSCLKKEYIYECIFNPTVWFEPLELWDR